MSKRKQKIANTELDNLVSNLRGDIGETVTSWVLMRQFMAKSGTLATGDSKLDIENHELAYINLLTDKLRDELVGRLSELAERKVGQLTFFFASEKLDCLRDEFSEFEAFINRSGIREKRNRDVSHKELPEKWSEHRLRNIPYRVLLKAVAMALRLMKRIDRIVLGPSAPFCWREARKRRYEFMSSPRAAYMLTPYLRLSAEDRIRVLEEELREGKRVWSQMTTSINDTPRTILACKEWGVLLLGDRLLPLNQYPLISMESTEFGAEEAESDSENAQHAGSADGLSRRDVRFLNINQIYGV